MYNFVLTVEGTLSTYHEVNATGIYLLF